MKNDKNISEIMSKVSIECLDHFLSERKEKSFGETVKSFCDDYIAANKGRRKTEWNGEGLPPVGTVCEIKNSRMGWVRCEIIAHKHFDCGAKPHAIAWIDGNNIDQSEGIRFRKIKSPEQIAAEERLHKIRNAHTAIARTLDSFRGDIPAEGVSRTIIEAMIDAGYSKQEQK